SVDQLVSSPSIGFGQPARIGEPDSFDFSERNRVKVSAGCPPRSERIGERKRANHQETPTQPTPDQVAFAVRVESAHQRSAQHKAAGIASESDEGLRRVSREAKRQKQLQCEQGSQSGGGPSASCSPKQKRAQRKRERQSDGKEGDARGGARRHPESGKRHVPA